MPSRDKVLQSIKPGMKLDRAFFLSIYADEIIHPGFSDIAIKALEDAGCSKARGYYDAIVADYEKKYQEGLREAAEWYQKKLDEEWERKVKETECQKQEKKQKLSKDDVSKQILGW